MPGSGWVSVHNIHLFSGLQETRLPEITITTADKESAIYYTLDQQNPTTNSSQYKGLFPTDGKVEVKAIALHN
jgi:hypothetical protein